MEYLNRLEMLLMQVTAEDKQDRYQGDCPLSGTRASQLSPWNEEIELHLASPHANSPLDDGKQGEEEHCQQRMLGLALQLERGLLVTLATILDVPPSNYFDNDNVGESANKDLTANVLKALVAKKCETQFVGGMLALESPPLWQLQLLFQELALWIRTSNNFFRWYLQIYLQRHSLVFPMISQPFQTKEMLNILLLLIEWNAKPVVITTATTSVDEENQPPKKQPVQQQQAQALARYACLMLFYVTYSPLSPNDESMQKTHFCLVHDLQFLPFVLRVLAHEPYTSAAMALALVRNVNNILVSLPGSAQTVLQTVLVEAGSPTESTPSSPRVSPWSSPQCGGPLTFPSVSRDMIIWALDSKESPFPGDPDDRRADLVVELLEIFYALGGNLVQQALAYPTLDANDHSNINNDNNNLAPLVLKVLNLDKGDKRCYQVQLSTMTLLMDADPSLARFLLEEDAVSLLLDILQQQIDAVLDATQVDNTAVAALTPSLAVVHKFSSTSTHFCAAVKEGIFPASQEEHFQDLVEQQQQQQQLQNGTDTQQQQKHNMQPLHAPKGTMRWKVIRLMTWPEGHIKRYANELLWVLCNCNSKEFVYRTGMGNAMPFLGAKGVVPMPPNTLPS